jgi:peptidoglycan/xylan/chitin deacetylase (PgdA/CDA1 family)
MEHVCAALSPLAPCLCGWMTCCDSRVLWHGDDDDTPDDAIALTIDDVPRNGTKIADVLQMMLLLRQRRARATFFVFFDQLNPMSSDSVEFNLLVNTFVSEVKSGGHEVGLHFPGRWGQQMSLTELRWRTEQSLQIAHRRFNLPIRYVRMPGGFSTPAQVTLLESYGLKVVNGTAYPGDADVCQCLSAMVIGRCAARLADGDGRIAILHDDKRLIAKLASFLAQLQLQGKRAVTLSDLFGPPRMTPTQAVRATDKPMETHAFFLPF